MIKGRITFKYIGESNDELMSFAFPLLRRDWKQENIPDSNIHEFSLSYYNHHAKYTLADIRFAMNKLYQELQAPYYRGEKGISPQGMIIMQFINDLSKMMAEEDLDNNPRMFRFSVDYDCGKYYAEISVDSDFKKVIKRHKPVLENDTIKFIVSEA